MGVRVLIQITPQLRILVAIDAIDGRKGIDSLAQLCREKLDADPVGQERSIHPKYSVDIATLHAVA